MNDHKSITSQLKNMSSSWWSGWLLNAAYAGGSLCAGALLLLYAFQDKLLYFPTIPGASKLTRDNPMGTCMRARCVAHSIAGQTGTNWLNQHTH